MATITIPDKLKAQVEVRATEGGYASVEEYVAAVLRSDAAAHADPKLEAVLIERLGGGPGIPLTPEFIAEFKRDVHDRRARQRRGSGAAAARQRRQAPPNVVGPATAAAAVSRRAILRPQVPDDLHAIVAYSDAHSLTAGDRFMAGLHRT